MSRRRKSMKSTLISGASNPAKGASSNKTYAKVACKGQEE